MTNHEEEEDDLIHRDTRRVTTDYQPDEDEESKIHRDTRRARSSDRRGKSASRSRSPGSLRSNRSRSSHRSGRSPTSQLRRKLKSKEPAGGLKSMKDKKHVSLDDFRTLKTRNQSGNDAWSSAVQPNQKNSSWNTSDLQPSTTRAGVPLPLGSASDHPKPILEMTELEEDEDSMIHRDTRRTMTDFQPGEEEEEDKIHRDTRSVRSSGKRRSKSASRSRSPASQVRRKLKSVKKSAGDGLKSIKSIKPSSFDDFGKLKTRNRLMQDMWSLAGQPNQKNSSWNAPDLQPSTTHAGVSLPLGSASDHPKPTLEMTDHEEEDDSVIHRDTRRTMTDFQPGEEEEEDKIHRDTRRVKSSGKRRSKSASRSRSPASQVRRKLKSVKESAGDGLKSLKSKKPSSFDDFRKLTSRNRPGQDAWSLAMQPNRKNSSWDPSNVQTSTSAGGIPSPAGSPEATDKRKGRREKSPSRSRSISPNSHRSGNRRGKRPKNERSKSTSNLMSTTTRSATGNTMPPAVADATVTNSGEVAITARSASDEQGEDYRRAERIRDLEEQNNRIKESLKKLSKKTKRSRSRGQGEARGGGKKTTLCKVLTFAAVYVFGVATGFLLSEIRRRTSRPTKEIYVTQSPTAVPKQNPTMTPTEFSYDEPTEEDCFAIESKEEVEGQDGMITRSYDVRFDVQLNELSTDWYGQLDEALTERAVPELACCKSATTSQRRLESRSMDFSIRGYLRMLKSIRCVVANGSTRGELNFQGGSCVELTGGLCVPAVVTFDLALKGDEPDGDIIDLVKKVINGDGSEPLVEKFDLERNIFSVVKLVEVAEHDPTEAPVITSPPTPPPTLSPTATPAPVVGPTTSAPTRVVTQSPTTRPPTPEPTSGGTRSPTTAPAPGVTPVPTQIPSAKPTSKPSSEPSESPSFSPTPVPTLLASSSPTKLPTPLPTPSPTSSPTTQAPSLTPSAAPTGRRQAIESILTAAVGTIYTSALDWLADTDTWTPPLAETDPDTAWLERYAMVSVYLAFNGGSWTNQGAWMTPSTSVCSWASGTCNSNNRAIKIYLNNYGLTGTIPTEIGLLRSLASFEIDNNSVGGTIPTEIGLPNLSHFEMDDNALTGTIPTEFALSPLTFLDISSNRLTGTIPLALMSLTALIFLRIDDQSLVGTIPTEVNLLTSLTRLNIDNTQIVGTIPDLSALVNMKALGLSDCNLSGSIPPGMFNNMMALEWLDLSNSNLTGSIPAIPNPSILTTCRYSYNCFSDVTNAGACELTSNCI